MSTPSSVSDLLDDLLVCEIGWNTDEQREVFWAARKRVQAAGSLVVMRRLRAALDAKIVAAEGKEPKP